MHCRWGWRGGDSMYLNYLMKTCLGSCFRNSVLWNVLWKIQDGLLQR